MSDLKMGLHFWPKKFKFCVFAKQAMSKKLELSTKFVTHTSANLRSPSVLKDRSECPAMKKNLINHHVQAQNYQKLRLLMFEFFINRHKNWLKNENLIPSVNSDVFKPKLYLNKYVNHLYFFYLIRQKSIKFKIFYTSADI